MGRLRLPLCVPWLLSGFDWILSISGPKFPLSLPPLNEPQVDRYLSDACQGSDNAAVWVPCSDQRIDQYALCIYSYRSCMYVKLKHT